MGKNRYSRFCQAILVLMIPSWLICEISVNAAVQTVIVSEPPAIVNFSGREIELPQFNPSLGSLESVTIDVKGTGALLQGFNHSGGPGSHRELSGQPLLGLSLQTTGGENLVTLTQLGMHPRGTPGHQGATDSTSSGLVPVRTFGQTTLTLDQQLMQFTGCGFIDLFLSGRSGLGHGESGNEALQTGLWVTGANIKVTYTYAAVPETSTWLAGAFALVLVVLVRRSNTQNAPSAD